jgi:CRP-like cAMP-binding protein
MILERPLTPEDENGLLATLPSAIYERLKPSLTRVRLEAGSTLYDVGTTIDHAWFITSGMVSLLAVTEDGDTVEIASVGREGLVGLSSMKNRRDMEFRAQVRIEGSALLVDRRALKNLNGQGSIVSELLSDYTHGMSERIAREVLCLRFHTTEQRLARWLLLAHSRTAMDAFELTHESFVDILGISRSVVSVAAGILQKKGGIRYLRGRVTIQNHRKLLASTCECYRKIRQAIHPHSSSGPLPTSGSVDFRQTGNRS